MSKDKTIIVDVDGVLLDYTGGIIDAYKSHYKECDNPTSLEDIFDGVMVRAIIALFNQTPNFSELQPHRGADVYLKKLKDEGFSIHAITACGDTTPTIHLRSDNLTNVFGDIFDKIVYAPLGSSKHHLLAEYQDTGYVFVEDTLEHYIAGECLGLDSVMMSTDFNMHVSTNRVHDWKELYEYIMRKY